jgi:hypothetical protein
MRGRKAAAGTAAVGDEVDLVAAMRERDAKLGRDRARAAVGRITGDADLHASPLVPPRQSALPKSATVDDRA